jgi:hypothetical protein
MRTAEENAREFGRHEKYGGWALALLVACSVEPGEGRTAGLRRGTTTPRRLDRDDGKKMSAAEFARKAGTTNDRVLRFLTAWESHAKDGVVPKARTLSPSDAEDYEWDFSDAGDWNEHYSGGFASPGSAGGIIDRNIKAASTPAERAKAAEAALDRMNEQTQWEIEQAILRRRAEDGRAARRLDEAVGEHRRREGRRSIATALESDEATDELRRAASALARAESARQEFGISDHAAERAALKRVDHFREMYGTDGRFSKNDREFLEEMGVSI